MGPTFAMSYEVILKANVLLGAINMLASLPQFSKSVYKLYRSWILVAVFPVLLLPSLCFSGDGVGSGGGTNEVDAKVKRRFKEVIARVETMDLSKISQRQKIQEFLVISKNLLQENPPEIEFVTRLFKCDKEKSEILDPNTTAWGCPGRLQLTQNFDLEDDSKVFHELTRLTPEFEMWDDEFQISVSVLNLNVKYSGFGFIVKRFPKNRFSLDDVKAEESSIRDQGFAFATNLIIEKDQYKLIVVIEPIDSGIKPIFDRSQ